MISYLNLTSGFTDLQAKVKQTGDAMNYFVRPGSLKQANDLLYIPMSYRRQNSREQTWIGYAEAHMSRRWEGTEEEVTIEKDETANATALASINQTIT